MANELARALQNNLRMESSDDELVRAMSALLIILLNRISNNTEDDDFQKELTNTILSKYPRPSSKANFLIPSPS